MLLFFRFGLSSSLLLDLLKKVVLLGCCSFLLLLLPFFFFFLFQCRYQHCCFEFLVASFSFFWWLFFASALPSFLIYESGFIFIFYFESFYLCYLANFFFFKSYVQKKKKMKLFIDAPRINRTNFFVCYLTNSIKK